MEKKRGPVPKSAAERFGRHVIHGGLDECWEWMGATTNGYGTIMENRRCLKAHRVSWFIYHGEYPPSDRDVCHRCDNRLCVNPHHLFLGTRAENMRDAQAKGRLDVPRRARRGDSHPTAKLREADIPLIRQYSADGWSTYRLASEFGVSRRTIANILHSRVWKHVA